MVIRIWARDIKYRDINDDIYQLTSNNISTNSIRPDFLFLAEKPFAATVSFLIINYFTVLFCYSK